VEKILIMVESFIDSFRLEIENPNPFLFSLILANKFNGSVFIKDDDDDSIIDFVVLIDDKLYDAYGRVSFKHIDIENYVVFDKLSTLFITNQYHKLKWLLINELNDDELYHRSMD
jgi:hypothetical protein